VETASSRFPRRASRSSHPLLLRYADGLPGTFTSNLWGEATEAYLKFQGADPISHPEVGRFKQ